MDGQKGRRQWMECQMERQTDGQAEIGSAGGTDRRTHGQDDGVLDGQKDRWSNWMLDGQRRPVCPSVSLCTLSCTCPSVHPSICLPVSTLVCPPVCPANVHQSTQLPVKSISPSLCPLPEVLTDRKMDGQTEEWALTDRGTDGKMVSLSFRPSFSLPIHSSFCLSGHLTVFLSISPLVFPSIRQPISPPASRTNWQTTRQKAGPTHRPKAVPTAAQLEVLNWQHDLKVTIQSSEGTDFHTPASNTSYRRRIFWGIFWRLQLILHMWLNLRLAVVFFFSSIDLLQPEQMKSVVQFLFCRSLCKQAGLKLHP